MSAIWKAPVEGRVRVADDHVDGDRQADLRVHGGPDKAVYAYAAEDTAWWADRLGRTLEPGAFGENLTVEGVDVQQWPIGQRVRAGGAIFEITMVCDPCHRMDELREGLRAELELTEVCEPCHKMDELRPGLRAEIDGKRGMLARVVRGGDVRVGDDIQLL